MNRQEFSELIYKLLWTYDAVKDDLQPEATRKAIEKSFESTVDKLYEVLLEPKSDSEGGE